MALGVVADSQVPNIGVPLAAVVGAADGDSAILTKSQYFSLPQRNGTQILVQLTNTGTGAFSAFLVDIMVSTDGGTTFSLYTSLDLIALGVQPLTVVGGGIWAVKLNTVTKSSGVPAGTVYVTLG